MLTILGVPLLQWAHHTLVPEAYRQLDRVAGCVDRWYWLLLDAEYAKWPQ